MNAFPLRDFIIEVGSLLEDRTFVRWTVNDLLDATTHTLRRMVVVRPDVFSKREEIVLVAGAEQELPVDVHRLLDMIHNAAGQKSAIRPMPLIVVDALHPNWRSGPRKNKIIHWSQAQKESRTYDVYPPAIAGTTVVASVTKDHVPLAHVANNLVTEIAPTVMVEMTSLLRPALMYGVAAHAWGRDGEYQNVSLAGQYSQMFLSELSNEFQAGVAARSTTDSKE